MTESHFFAPPEAFGSSVVTLTGDEAHHAARVLRVRVGERITVADNGGRVVTALISSIDGDVVADIVDDRVVEDTRPVLTLCQALAKSDKLDEVVQRAVEIGVRRVVPFVAERSIVKWDEKKASKAVERWRAIALSAAKQSRSPRLCVIDDVDHSAAEALVGAELSLVMHEAAPVRLRDALPADAPASVSVSIGPEGGFTDDEISALAAGGAHVVSLGPQVLRTETAGIVACSVVAFAYGVVG